MTHVLKGMAGGAQVLPTGQKLLATGNGLFKKLGALRAL